MIYAIVWNPSAIAAVLTPLAAIAGGIWKIFRRLSKQDLALSEIHVLVNNRMTEALNRIDALEGKLGLMPGEAIPSPSVVTPVTKVEE